MKVARGLARHQSPGPTTWLVRSMTCVGVVIGLCSGPAIAQTIAPRRLLEVVDFGAPVISPNGLQVAFRVEQASVERNTYDPVWYVQDIDGDTPPRRLADGGAPLPNSAGVAFPARSAEPTSELTSLMRISY